jgi:dephospho-CoA kinase
VPELPAKDVIDIQLGVADIAVGDELRPALRAAGFVAVPEITADNPKPTEPDPGRWAKRFWVSADPARGVNLHVRRVDSAGYRYALLFRDWLRANPSARAAYLAGKQRAAAEHAHDEDCAGYAEAKEPWFDAALPEADRWATISGWRIPDSWSGRAG